MSQKIINAVGRVIDMEAKAREQNRPKLPADIGKIVASNIERLGDDHALKVEKVVEEAQAKYLNATTDKD